MQMWGNEYRTTMVCIDSYEDRIPKGRLYNRYAPEGIAFRGVMDFLKKMEDMLDQMQFPQAFSAVRSFSPESAKPWSAPIQEAQSQSGSCGTLALRILFRQNASWQGSITWLEGKREESFRSVLELLFLMDSAAAAMEMRNDTIQNFRW